MNAPEGVCATCGHPETMHFAGGCHHTYDNGMDCPCVKFTPVQAPNIEKLIQEAKLTLKYLQENCTEGRLYWIGFESRIGELDNLVPRAQLDKQAYEARERIDLERDKADSLRAALAAANARADAYEKLGDLNWLTLLTRWSFNDDELGLIVYAMQTAGTDGLAPEGVTPFEKTLLKVVNLKAALFLLSCGEDEDALAISAAQDAGAKPNYGKDWDDDDLDNGDGD